MTLRLLTKHHLEFLSLKGGCTGLSESTLVEIPQWHIVDDHMSWLICTLYITELLRKSAEHTLMDMVQLLFSRLPQFKEDPKWSANMKKVSVLLCFIPTHIGLL